MSDLKAYDLYLVGSLAVPGDTVEEAMNLAARHLGELRGAADQLAERS